MPLRVAPLALAGLTVAAALDVWLALDLADVASAPPPAAEHAAWQPKPAAASEPIPVVKPLAEYRQTLERPLFAKTRAPYVPPPAPPPPALVQAPPPAPAAPVFVDPGFSVGGVMINGGTRKAYLMKKPQPHGLWVREGEDFMGWKVQSVGASTARLQQNDRTIELRLYPER